MSYCFHFNGRSSELRLQLDEPIILNVEDSYEIGLVNFVSYNSIPNVDKFNNNFYYEEEKITIPIGVYEVSDINKYLQTHIEEEGKETENPTFLSITGNQYTQKSEIKCNKKIYFNKPNSIGSLLGFKKKELDPNVKHVSDSPVDIFKVNSINIDCNIVTNSYNNDPKVKGHILHTFTPKVLPGTRIIESPATVLYLPIKNKYINEIVLKIIDQDGKIVNFNEELISVRLHLRNVIG